jgi:hypothetical protein
MRKSVNIPYRLNVNHLEIIIPRYLACISGAPFQPIHDQLGKRNLTFLAVIGRDEIAVHGYCGYRFPNKNPQNLLFEPRGSWYKSIFGLVAKHARIFRIPDSLVLTYPGYEKVVLTLLDAIFVGLEIFLGGFAEQARS